MEDRAISCDMGGSINKTRNNILYALFTAMDSY